MTRLDYELIEIAEDGFLAAVVLFGLWRGDRLVRAAALTLGAAGAGVVVAWYAGPPSRAWIPGLEAALLAGLATLAVRRRPPPWLVLAGAAQLAVVASYAARALDPHIGRLAFLTAANTWSTLAQAAVLWGAWEAHRARRTEAAG